MIVIVHPNYVLRVKNCWNAWKQSRIKKTTIGTILGRILQTMEELRKVKEVFISSKLWRSGNEEMENVNEINDLLKERCVFICNESIRASMERWYSPREHLIRHSESINPTDRNAPVCESNNFQSDSCVWVVVVVYI